jgi:hypothetical protein
LTVEGYLLPGFIVRRLKIELQCELKVEKYTLPVELLLPPKKGMKVKKTNNCNSRK